MRITINYVIEVPYKTSDHKEANLAWSVTANRTPDP